MSQISKTEKPVKITVYLDENLKQWAFKCVAAPGISLSTFDNVQNNSDPWECLSCVQTNVEERFNGMYDGKFCYKCAIFLEYMEGKKNQ